MRCGFFAIVAVCVAVMPAFAQQGAPSAVPVGTVMAERKPISKSLDFVGRIEAINRVEIKARVSGFWRASCSRKAMSSRKARRFIASSKACFRPRSSRRKAPWSAARRPKL